MRTPALVALAAAAAVAGPGTAAAAGPETAVIRSGVPWFDTDGNRVYAGGANMYVEGGVYYLIGEGKKVLSGVSSRAGGGCPAAAEWGRSSVRPIARPHPTSAPACAGHLRVLQPV